MRLFKELLKNANEYQKKADELMRKMLMTYPDKVADATCKSEKKRFLTHANLSGFNAKTTAVPNIKCLLNQTHTNLIKCSTTSKRQSSLS